MSAFRRDFLRGGEVLAVTLRHLAGDRYRVRVGDAVHEIDASRLPDGRVRFTLDGRTFVADSAPCGKTWQVRVAGHTHCLELAAGRARRAETGGGLIAAPMTGTIGQVSVQLGQKVEEGATVIVLSAMKMEHKLTAGIAGTVVELGVEVGTTVDEGTILARIEPRGKGSGEGESLFEEHDEITGLLARAQVQDAMRLPAVLKELHTLLVRHCSSEEAPDGLFARIEQRAPGLEREVAKLRAEHTTLLAELLQLSYRQNAAEEMRAGVAAFRQRLDAHERMERELFAGLLDDEQP